MNIPDENYDTYQIARDIRIRAERWFRNVKSINESEMHDGKYRTAKRHCLPPKIGLMPPGINELICTEKHISFVPAQVVEIFLEKILNNLEEEIEAAISELKEREAEALVQCQSYIDHLQEQINKAKKEEDAE